MIRIRKRSIVASVLTAILLIFATQAIAFQTATPSIEPYNYSGGETHSPFTYSYLNLNINLTTLGINTLTLQEIGEKTTPSLLSSNTIVYITKTGKKYHIEGCSYLKKSKIPISLSKAKSKGYTPCSKCHPPR